MKRTMIAATPSLCEKKGAQSLRRSQAFVFVPLSDSAAAASPARSRRPRLKQEGTRLAEVAEDAYSFGEDASYFSYHLLILLLAIRVNLPHYAADEAKGQGNAHGRRGLLREVRVHGAHATAPTGACTRPRRAMILAEFMNIFNGSGVML